MQCTRCGGRGDVMTYDPGICGAEEYGTCGLCKGTKRLPPELEALHNKVAELEEKISPREKMLFAFDDDPESDSYNMFLVVTQDYWEQYGYLDDRHIGGMPEGFDEVMESMFEYNGTAEEGRELLLTMGYKEEKKLLP